MKIARLSAAFFAVLVASCQPPSMVDQDCTPATFEGAFADEVTLCQNWNANEQQEFWFLSQGSQIIPYDWFLALEQPNNQTRFADGAHMDSFRYLPQQPTPRNPDALPIGFTKGGVRGNDDYAAIADDWLGLNCAACHTGQVEFDGNKMLIDGAPTMADFEGFMLTLVEAMQTTLDDPAKFDRFASDVSGTGGGTDELREQLTVMTGIRRDWNERNKGDHAYGFARLDAIGAIFNEVTVTALDLPENRRSANAPVSYPFIWDTPQHDRVQWNGSVANAGPGALGRNVGEVLGVFGALELNTGLVKAKGHTTSVNIRNLGQLEELIWTLQSPVWPESILPEIDRAIAMDEGRAAFEKYCLSCHADIRRDDAEREIRAILTPLDGLDTDRMMAANFRDRMADSGKLKGLPKRYVGLLKFGETDRGVEFLGNAVIGTIVFGLSHDPIGTLKAINAGRDSGDRAKSVAKLPKLPLEFAREIVAKLPSSDDPPPLVYKARPLNGIWATAPYLHNGSVRTMRQLLLPTAQRQSTFRVGSREFDPDDMGFEDAGGYLFDTALPGNSNAGHEYGADELAADPAMLNALLEYLKTL